MLSQQGEGATGVTGGALPQQGGIILSLERLNHIISIDCANRFAIVEAGIITETFCKALAEVDMYFPVQPGSSGSCFIGGNIATNAGGPRSCKYGSVNNFVLNLEVVLSTGDIIWSGAAVHKNATGLNLTQLFAGSEGMLGIITKAYSGSFGSHHFQEPCWPDSVSWKKPVGRRLKWHKGQYNLLQWS